MKGKVVILGLVLALALTASACKKSSDDNAAAAAGLPIGQLFITAMGGNSAGWDGGEGGQFNSYSQAQGSLLSWGSFAIPNVVMPAGALMITTNTTWDDAMQSDLENGLFDGLYVAPGVTLTVPDDVYLWYCGFPGCYVYGLYGYTYGPVVIMGNIVSDADNTEPVIFSVFARQDTAADDNTILLTGLLDMSGPSSDVGDGVYGGDIYLCNDYYQDTEFGIYIAGNIITKGGDATDALSGWYGGDGGDIDIRGGDNENILVAANIITNGGNAAGDGDGGDAGDISIWNENDYWGVPTNDSTGQIAFFNVNQVNVNGGAGWYTGGDAAYDIYLTADRAGWYVTVPMIGNGGNANSTDTDSIDGGYGGYGITNYFEINANEDWVQDVDLIAEADVIILSGIQAVGGTGTYAGGYGGYFYLYATEGDLYIGDIIDKRGGNATADDTNSYGGYGGGFEAFVYNYNSDATYGNADWMLIRDVIADGGNGGEYGGDGGWVYLYDYSTGNIYLPPASVATRGGIGSVEMGDLGYFWTEGHTISIPWFPTLDQMP